MNTTPSPLGGKPASHEVPFRASSGFLMLAVAPLLLAGAIASFASVGRPADGRFIVLGIALVTAFAS
jgi:hypothetical protein